MASLVSDLSSSVWDCGVSVVKKSPVCPTFHKQPQQTESCQPLDLMGVVVTKVVMSSQRSDVTWDAEAMV